MDLALGRFRRRPPISALPTGLQRDIRSFFGSYATGCRRADDLLFRAGDAEAVDDACRRSAVGKLGRSGSARRCSLRGAGSARWRSLRGAGKPTTGPSRFPRLASRTPIGPTAQEVRAGLLDETASIGTRAGWAERLREREYALRGHRLVRSRAGDRPVKASSG